MDHRLKFVFDRFAKIAPPVPPSTSPAVSAFCPSSCSQTSDTLSSLSLFVLKQPFRPVHRRAVELGSREAAFCPIPAPA